MSDWQPIETAPKDESWFLGYWADSPMCWGPYELVAWNATLGFFCEQDVSERSPCTHWRPLPPPPPLGTSGGVSDTYELPELPEELQLSLRRLSKAVDVLADQATETIAIATAKGIADNSHQYLRELRDQIEEYALIAVQRERERCAKLAEFKADSTYRGKVNSASQHAADMVRDCAEIIRKG
jgi:hypothetical protein